jgi:ribonuclease VapC
LGPEKGMSGLLNFLERADCEVVDFTRLHFVEAAMAFQQFGKGRHPAALNMGDCNSYATAKVAGATLLYKGNDFALTDLPKLTPPA